MQVQACARMQTARRQLQRAQRAATLMQAHWRRRCAVRLRQQMAAAVCIQRYTQEALPMSLVKGTLPTDACTKCAVNVHTGPPEEPSGAC